MSSTQLVVRAFAAFADEVASSPRITLRGGEALDGYEEPPAYDPILDAITEEYLRSYASGLTFLDPISWRHYMPHLIEYTVRHYQDGSDVIDTLLSNLRPPDREPPRLASLSPEQEAVIAQLLELLAFSEQSKHQKFACQVLEEWWIPDALYREHRK